MLKIEPVNLEIEEACRYIGCRRTKLFHYLRVGILVRRKFGRKSVVCFESAKALAERGHS